MKYFQTLPNAALINTNDGSYVILKDLLTRSQIIPNLLDNSLVFYEYDVQEGDTPEIIATKYYGDPYRHWIVLHTNNIIDPLWEWPLSGRVLEDYITDKYDDPSALYSYEMVTTTYDGFTGYTTVTRNYIGEEKYNSLNETSTTYTIGTTTCTVSITKGAVSFAEYERRKNEERRKIKLLKKDYVSQIEKELTTLMIR